MSRFSINPALRRMIWSYRTQLLGGMVFLGLGAAVNLAFPALIRSAIDGGGFSQEGKHVALLLSTALCLIVIQGICFYYRYLFFNLVGHRVVADIRNQLFGSIISRGAAFFDSHRAADLVSRLSADTVLLHNSVGIHLSVFIRYSLQVAVGIVMMCLISARLALAVVLIVPVLVLLSIALGKRLKAASKAAQTALGATSTIAQESFGAIRTVKLFTSEAAELKRFVKAVTDTLAASVARSKIAALLSAGMAALLNAAIVLVVWYGITLVQSGTLTVGDLTAFMLYGAVVAVSFALIAGTYSEFVQASGAAERVFELLNPQAELPVPAQPRRLDTKTNGEIELRDVSFAYPSRPEIPILNGVTLHVRAGERLALVGPSGAGKTTLVALVTRLYDCTSGAVRIDGIDVREMEPTELRSHIGLVSQEPELFGVSIRDNLLYGKPNATESELQEACRNASILEFVDKLPQRFDTLVGDRGVQLSGGQRQRLAIARVMLKNPQILILDEATSQLDAENEFLVRQALGRLMQGRTTLIIAHRLATVQDADRVVVLQDGRIVQEGTHEALSTREGLYRQLVERQVLTVGGV